jgi:hypothetical protein
VTTLTTRLAALSSGPRRRLHDLVPAPRTPSDGPDGEPPAASPGTDEPGGDDLLDSLGFTSGTD